MDLTGPAAAANALLIAGWTGFVLIITASLALERRGPRPARTSGLLLDLVGVAGMLSLYGGLVAGVPWDVWRAPGPAFHPLLAGLGAALFVAGWGLFGWARWTLGRWWSADVQIKQGQELRISGPYRLVRHPLYSGLIAAGLGALLLTGRPAWVGGLAAIAGYVLGKAWLEEQALAAHFGPAWHAYRRRVPAFLPRLRRNA
jgi:protein-S-isoprenylcysteine O-methyltransferase Ste14